MKVSYCCKGPESILKTDLIRRCESGNAASGRGTAWEKVRK